MPRCGCAEGYPNWARFSINTPLMPWEVGGQIGAELWPCSRRGLRAGASILQKASWIAPLVSVVKNRK